MEVRKHNELCTTPRPPIRWYGSIQRLPCLDWRVGFGTQTEEIARVRTFLDWLAVALVLALFALWSGCWFGQRGQHRVSRATAVTFTPITPPA